MIATKDNLSRNHLNTDRFTVYLPEDCPTLKADVVVANILAGPLVELASTLTSHVKLNGKICLSGILKQQANDVMAAYSGIIDFDPIEEKDGWVRISGTKIA